MTRMGQVQVATPTNHTTHHMTRDTITVKTQHTPSMDHCQSMFLCLFTDLFLFLMGTGLTPHTISSSLAIRQYQIILVCLATPPHQDPISTPMLGTSPRALTFRTHNTFHSQQLTILLLLLPHTPIWSIYPHHSDRWRMLPTLCHHPLSTTHRGTLPLTHKLITTGPGHHQLLAMTGLRSP